MHVHLQPTPEALSNQPLFGLHNNQIPITIKLHIRLYPHPLNPQDLAALNPGDCQQVSHVSEGPLKQYRLLYCLGLPATAPMLANPPPMNMIMMPRNITGPFSPAPAAEDPPVEAEADGAAVYPFQVGAAVLEA